MPRIIVSDSNPLSCMKTHHLILNHLSGLVGFMAAIVMWVTFPASCHQQPKAVTNTPNLKIYLHQHNYFHLFRTSMASFGDILTHDAAVDLIKSGDTDGDGFLNFVEFTVVLRDILLE